MKNIDTPIPPLIKFINCDKIQYCKRKKCQSGCVQTPIYSYGQLETNTVAFGVISVDVVSENLT